MTKSDRTRKRKKQKRIQRKEEKREERLEALGSASTQVEEIVDETEEIAEEVTEQGSEKVPAEAEPDSAGETGAPTQVETIDDGMIVNAPSISDDVVEPLPDEILEPTGSEEGDHIEPSFEKEARSTTLAREIEEDLSRPERTSPQRDEPRPSDGRLASSTEETTGKENGEGPSYEGGEIPTKCPKCGAKLTEPLDTYITRNGVKVPTKLVSPCDNCHDFYGGIFPPIN